MKTIQLIFCLAILLGSCKKDKEPISVTSEVSESFTSLDDFYFKKGPRSQSFTMDATAGGTFISSQGTTVIIPAEAFENSTGSLVTGPVTIEFKDLYKKSDMLMANMPTVDITGKPLKSGGEFYIKVMSNAEALQIRSSKNILVKMPFQAEGPDPGMMPFIGIDTAQQLLWMAQQNDSLGVDLNGYVYTLYSLGSSVDSGTWGNSDNPNFFFNYTQTHLTIHTDDSTNYRTDVFIIFKTVRSMVHVYQSPDYEYYFAPVGLECTVVAIKMAQGKFYSSFTPITITPNQVVNFSFTETTADEFIDAIDALN